MVKQLSELVCSFPFFLTRRSSFTCRSYAFTQFIRKANRNRAGVIFLINTVVLSRTQDGDPVRVSQKNIRCAQPDCSLISKNGFTDAQAYVIGSIQRQRSLLHGTIVPGAELCLYSTGIVKDEGMIGSQINIDLLSVGRIPGLIYPLTPEIPLSCIVDCPPGSNMVSRRQFSTNIGDTSYILLGIVKRFRIIILQRNIRRQVVRLGVHGCERIILMQRVAQLNVVNNCRS